MNKNQLAKEKEAGGVTHQPLQDRNRAAQPERLNREESTRGTATLQEKVIRAARKMVEEYQAWDDGSWDLSQKSCVETFLHRFQHQVYCTPRNLFFKRNEQWIKVTEKDVVGVLPDNIEDKEFYAGDILTTLRGFCKDQGKVNWTLPRINKQEGGAL